MLDRAGAIGFSQQLGFDPVIYSFQFCLINEPPGKHAKPNQGATG
jgi:hypothetical protein